MDFRIPTLRPSKSALLARDFSGLGLEPMEVILSVGLENGDGEGIRTVALRSLSGREEQHLSRVGRDVRLPTWVSRILGETVTWKGRSLGAERAARLAVADRDLLIVCLRLLTFGPELWGVTQCPRDGCGSRLDFTFDLTTVAVPSGSQARLPSASVTRGAEAVTFRFREPDGTDQEAVAALARENPQEAGLTLLSRCVVEWNGEPGVPKEVLRRLPPEFLSSIDGMMSAGMTSFDWDVELSCTECDHRFAATLDIQSYFFQELRCCEDDFWQEVHLLASSYHWSEADILGLPRWKRKKYLGLIDRHLQRSR